MATIKTQAHDGDVDAFLDAVPDVRRRADARALRALMERATGVPPVMWGPSIIGFGTRPATTSTGTNDWFVVGFSPRKAAVTIYGVHDDDAVDAVLEDLGPHTTSKGCLSIKRLDAVDQDVLARAVQRAWERGCSPS